LATAIIPIIVTLSNFIQFSDHVNMVVVITNYAVIGIYMAFQSIVIARLYAAYFKGISTWQRDVVEILKQYCNIERSADNLLCIEATYLTLGFLCAQVEGYFSLGKFSLPIAVIALLYGVSMIINLLWPTTYNDVTGYLSIIITAIILGSGTVIVLLFVKEQRIVEPSKEEVNPLLTY
jgi:hypothetical protein